MQTARLNSNLELRKTARHSTATAPASRSAAAPIKYSSATSAWRAKQRRAVIELPRRISISTPSTISASTTRAAKAISRGRRHGQTRRPTSRGTRPRQNREKWTWTASNPNGMATTLLPRRIQRTEANPGAAADALPRRSLDNLNKLRLRPHGHAPQGVRAAGPDRRGPSRIRWRCRRRVHGDGLQPVGPHRLAHRRDE
jgi:hypothetical protein